MILRRILLLAGMLFSASLFGQSMKLCYDHIYDAARGTDSLKVYLKGDADTTLALRAVNFSVAFHDSCAVFDTLESYLTGVWSGFFEQIRVSNNLSLTYNNRNYDSRVQYGNSDPGLPMPNPVLVPASENDSLLLFTLTFRGSCSQKTIVEDESANALNQFADEQFNPVEYAYFPCQGMDSVFFCTRQRRDSVAQQDSIRIFLEGNAEKSIGLSEVNFSIAFRDSCASFDSLRSEMNTIWGDSLGFIDIQDSLSLSYGGKSYDSRLTYRHQNPNFSAFNLLLTPTQSRFPKWVSTLYFSGNCSQDIYLENQAEYPQNLMLNQLDRLVGYSIKLCDSLPEDTIVLSVGEMQRSGWRIYPNPVGEQLFIEHLHATHLSGKMQLTDISGKIVWEESLHTNRKILQKEMSDIPAGMYILKIKNKNGYTFHYRLFKK